MHKCHYIECHYEKFSIHWVSLCKNVITLSVIILRVILQKCHYWVSLSKTSLHWVSLCENVVTLSVIMKKFQYIECHYAKMSLHWVSFCRMSLCRVFYPLHMTRRFAWYISSITKGNDRPWHKMWMRRRSEKWIKFFSMNSFKTAIRFLLRRCLS
jgi:hypothetical protein